MHKKTQKLIQHLKNIGQNDLAERMKRIAQDMGDHPYLPDADEDPEGQHEQLFSHWYPIYQDVYNEGGINPGRLIGLRKQMAAHLKDHPSDMQARVQLHAIDEALRKQGHDVQPVEIPNDSEIDFDQMAREIEKNIDSGPDQEPLDMAGLFSSKGVTFGTSVPYSLGDPRIEKVGFADIKRITIPVIAKADNASAIVSIARQKVFRWLAEQGIDPGAAVKFRPTVARESKQKMFTDENPSSQTTGDTKRGNVFSVSFELTPDANKYITFATGYGSTGETYPNVAERIRQEREEQGE